MNFIQQAFNVKHEFWRYLLGSIIVFIAAMIGQFPFMGVVMFQAEDLTTLNETTIMQVLEPNLNLFLMLLSFVVGLVALFLVIKYLHKQTITHATTARKKIDWKRIWFAFFFWGVITSALVLIDYFYLSPDDYLYNFEWKRFAILAVIAIAMIPLQTSLEEYLFRGYLMQGFGTGTIHKHFPIGFIFSIIGISLYVYLSVNYIDGLLQNILTIFGIVSGIVLLFYVLKSMKFFESEFYQKLHSAIKRNWTPLFITSAIFGLLHIANPEIEKLGYSLLIYYIGTGLFLGIITLMDEGMELALGFHAANNLITALLVTADWTALQTHSILKDVAEPKLEFIDLVLPVFIMFPILIFIFAKKYKWTNWKDKLFGEVKEPPKEDYKVIGES